MGQKHGFYVANASQREDRFPERRRSWRNASPIANFRVEHSVKRLNPKPANATTSRRTVPADQTHRDSALRLQGIVDTDRFLDSFLHRELLADVLKRLA